MTKSPPTAKYGALSPGDLDGMELDDYQPLSRQEADAVKARIQPVSVISVLVVQIVTGLVLAAAFWAVSQSRAVGWSVLYGAAAVVFPAALFARGLSRQRAVTDAGTALVGFFVWELVKIGVTVAMLLVAPRLVSQLSWLALLAGFVVTMKVYWLAMWFQLAHSTSIKKNR